MFEILLSPFMQKAFIAGTLVSVLTGMLSVFIVLRKMSFIGAGISHAAFGGVAIGFFTGINPMISAFIYTILIAIGIESVSRTGKLAQDVSIGIFYSVSMALGIALVSMSKSYNVDLFGYLFGNILAITNEEILVTLVLFSALMLLIISFLKELFFTTYNEELAQVSGIRVRLLNIFFFISLAITIVLSIRVVGVILVSALLVIPGATARLFARNLFSMILLSCIAGAGSVLAGLIISYHFDIAPSACIVLTASALFFIALFLKKGA
jgi:ABC-type Mn2+/Zn2+ transport system permease subunit